MNNLKLLMSCFTDESHGAGPYMMWSEEYVNIVYLQLTVNMCGGWCVQQCSATPCFIMKYSSVPFKVV